MTKIAQIEDRGAAVAWSPIRSHADIVALGSKDSGTIGFDDLGGELELYDFGITSNNGTPRAVGSLKTNSRFSSIDWTAGPPSSSSQHPMGLIAGGMEDGTIHIYDPLSILDGKSDEALLATLHQHAGAVTSLAFNSHPSHSYQLASGGRNGEILIVDLSTPSSPTCTTLPGGQGAEITAISWNTEVPHIVASSSGNGTATVWDLTKNRAWCELRCEPSGASVSSIGWNPGQGMLLMTSSSDDRSPVLKLWDLRASMDMPLATLEGHTAGVLSFDWCPHDESLLVSCGKDNRTLLWDVNTLKPIAELPNENASNANTTNMNATNNNLTGLSFDNDLSSSQQKRYDVRWSPHRRGVLSTCSFDRKVQAHSVIAVATKIGRPPKWMKPGGGVRCGVGGSILSFSSVSRDVRLDEYVERPELRDVAIGFESSIANGNYVGFSLSKAEMAIRNGDVYESQVWCFMQAVLEQDTRAQVLSFLGLDPLQIKRAADGITGGTNNGDDGGLDDMNNLSFSNDNKATPPMTPSTQKAVNDLILIGDFQSAVDLCFRLEHHSDALVLASCGGAELWQKTLAEYISSQKDERPFLSVVSAVIHDDLEGYVLGSDPKKWTETLGVICTYAKAESFRSSCESLGDRLEAAGDFASASLCFMSALNLEKAARYWTIQLDEANKAVDGGEDHLALHNFIEKVAIFRNATDSSKELPQTIATLMYRYAKLIAEQGLLPTAAKYCRSNSQECRELADRLYRSKYSQECLHALGYTPEFPFNYVTVNVAPKSSTTTAAAGGRSSSRAATGGSNVASRNGTSYQNGQSASRQYQTNTQAMDTRAGGGNTQANNGQLPAGWVALQDPSSGRTYYANQSTGETTWDMPVMPEPTAAPTAAPTNVSQHNGHDPTATETPQKHSNANAGNTPGASNALKLATKYGDGFVTSASHPELGAQYGNVGTSNPYTDSSRPGTAVVTKIDKPPVSGTFNPDKPPDVSDEFKPVVDGLMARTAALSELTLSFSENKQLTEVKKGVAFFSKRLARNEISLDIAEKVGQILSSMESRQFSVALTIHTGLVNSEWREHKDWLKGMKFLIQLSSKRL